MFRQHDEAATSLTALFGTEGEFLYASSVLWWVLWQETKVSLLSENVSSRHSQTIYPDSAFKKLTKHLFLRIKKTRKGISVFTEITHNNSNVFAH